MAHDNGDDTNPHVVPIATPAPARAGSTDTGSTDTGSTDTGSTDTGSTDTGTSGTASQGGADQGGEGTEQWVLGAHAIFAVEDLVGALEVSPAADSLFGRIQTLPQEQQRELTVAVVDALREAHGQSAGQRAGRRLPLPKLVVVIPVAYWCPKGHLLFPYETLTPAEGPQCPDHHEELELLYTRKKQG
jgi:hypothetical protein